MKALKTIVVCLLSSLICFTGVYFAGFGLTGKSNPAEWLSQNKTVAPFIGENGNWYIDGKDTGVKATGTDGNSGTDGKDGKDGADGADGQDGDTPYIGENGNWFIGDVDTGIKAAGTDGKDGAQGENGADGADGKTPYIGENGNWYIGDTDTGVKAVGTDGKDGADGKPGENGADGQDGKTPYIGENGNWYIGNTDTGVKATGTDGQDGADGKPGENGADGQDGKTPYIGENGNWYIGDTDTGVKAVGTDGQDGADGLTHGVVFQSGVYLNIGYKTTSKPSDQVTKINSSLYRHHIYVSFANFDIYNTRQTAYTSWEDFYNDNGNALFACSGSSITSQNSHYGLWIAQEIKAEEVYKNDVLGNPTDELYYRGYIRCKFYELTPKP